jgi:nucleoside 2-deoxyribosyltransferase
MKKVYIAGPGVFRRDAREHGRELIRLLKRNGLTGLYPLEGIPDVTSPSDIKRHNKNLIRVSDAVLADISPFRGPNMDPGTAWEIGFAEASLKVVSLYTSDRATLLARVRRDKAVTRLMTPGGEEYYDDNGMLIENFGLIENPMIDEDVVHSSAREAVRWLKERL